jgi:hypothetical protein
MFNTCPRFCVCFFFWGACFCSLKISASGTATEVRFVLLPENGIAFEHVGGDCMSVLPQANQWTK